MSTEYPRRMCFGGPKDARAVFALGVWSSVTLIAAVLMSRRLAGAFSSSVPDAIPCVSATIAFLLSLAAHALWSMAYPSAAFNRNHVIAGALTLMPPLVLGAASWTSPSVFVGGYLAGLLIVSSLAVVVTRDLSLGLRATASIVLPTAITGQSSGVNEKTAIAKTVPETEVVSDVVIDDSSALDLEAEEEETLNKDPSVLQWMTRRQLQDGQELVEGSVRVCFESGDRFAVVHVSFVPPMTGRPQAECHVLNDFDGRARVAAAEIYGLRIEARRSADASDSAEIEVAFCAQFSKNQAKAA